MSARPSTAVPGTSASGATKSGEPMAMSLRVISALSRFTALARPKSATFTRPRASSITFEGLMSRCTMPSSCAKASASHTAVAMRTASPASSRPCARISSATSVPSMNSITKYSSDPPASRAMRDEG